MTDLRSGAKRTTESQTSTLSLRSPSCHPERSEESHWSGEAKSSHERPAGSDAFAQNDKLAAMAEIPSFPVSRRNFLSTSAKLGAVIAAAPYIARGADVGAGKSDTVNVGLIGCGAEGQILA